jgi:alpha-galactosidase
LNYVIEILRLLLFNISYIFVCVKIITNRRNLQAIETETWQRARSIAMDKTPTTRRRFLKLAASAGATTGAAMLTVRAKATGDPPAEAGASLGDHQILLEFDPRMRMRVSKVSGASDGDRVTLSDWSIADSLLLDKGVRVGEFALREQSQQEIHTSLGAGRRLRLVGSADGQFEKTLEVELYESYPGFAFYRTSYRNLSGKAVTIRGWTNCALRLSAAPQAGFWSYCGSTHADRRDWVQPVKPGFSQLNFMGMSASDYGGGTPIVDVWRRDAGVAIGHLQTTPEAVALPVNCDENGVTLAMTATFKRSIGSAERIDTYAAFVAVHAGDYFGVLDCYRRVMSTCGFECAHPPKAAYEPIWCAWGYERQCTLELIENTLPKVQELGLRWAVIDDGWQSNVGDWKLNSQKYPRGDVDMKQLVEHICARDLKARLWWAPLAAAPGSDLLHDHTDMLLLDREGAVQNISWWNSFYLCPAYAPTIDYSLELVRTFLAEWGYAGLKIDGQHLNAVAPCYNPAHHHARPEESVEKLQDFFQAIYQTAVKINPEAVVELCPCGTSYSFFNLRSLNQAPASDPESSWQVRHKGKTLKALIGPGAAYAGDHVELSDGGHDFASTVGIGAIVSTKFTWPHDPKPKDSFLLTPEKERLWRKWITLYNQRQLPLGNYRGELYDIGFDKPETHAIEKSGTFYYAFYAHEFSGRVPLRGLSASRYRVRDYFNDRVVGEVSGTDNTLAVAFKDFLVLEAIPT